jgi:hypothetical protein
MTLADRLFATFDRLYVINLAARDDRRREMAGELARLGLGFDHTRVRLFEAIRPGDAGPFRTIGARGAFLSQLGVLTEARRDGLRAILMLEDDCDFVASATERLPGLLDQLDAKGIGLFYGGYELPEGDAGVNLADPALVQASPALTIRLAHCLGFGPAAIDTLPGYLATMLERPAGSSDGGPMDVDGAYNWFRRTYPNCPTYLACPPLAYQRPSRTDISATGLLDRLPGPLRQIARVARRAWQRRG